MHHSAVIAGICFPSLQHLTSFALICAFSEAAMDCNVNRERKTCTINMHSLDLNYQSLKTVTLHGQFREAAGKIW